MSIPKLDQSATGNPLDGLRWLISRMVNNGASIGDVEKVYRTAYDHDSWYTAWKAYGDQYRDLAETAVVNRNLITARDLFLIASVYYRNGQFVIHADNPMKRALLQASVDAYTKAGEFFEPSVERVEIPAAGGSVPGFFRAARVGLKGPAMLILHGADSTKEETHFICKSYWDRGIATLTIDGPGQAEARLFRGMTYSDSAYEAACQAAIDYLADRPEIDPNRIGVFGQCMGGYMALRAAASDKRIKAVVLLSAFYSLECWMEDHIPMPFRRNFAYVFGLPGLPEMKETARQVNLDGVLERVDCPVLVVHSTGDHLSTPAEAERIAVSLQGKGEMLMIRGSVHCCSDIIPQIRPKMADWIVHILLQ